MKIVTTSQMRELDRSAIASGISGLTLMERAGFAVAHATIPFLKMRDSRSAFVFAGKGHNGGDAFVVARHLASAGCEPLLVLACRRAELTGDALTHYQQLSHGVTVIEQPDTVELRSMARERAPSVVVDGLLGTGLVGAVREPYGSLIHFINELGAPVVAIDLPSGLDSDSGEVCGCCVRADVTVTMGLPKTGLLRGQALDWVGRLEAADIGFPAELVGAIRTEAELITMGEVAALIPPRPRICHKGDFGHVLVIAGSEGYTGAPVLTAHAAARSGAGLVTLAVPRVVYPMIAATCPPDIMPRPLDTILSCDGFNALVIGPGLGQSEVARTIVRDTIQRLTIPAVVDADALNLMAGDLTVLGQIKTPLILTPHPGEMSRLTGETVSQINADRWKAAREFCGRYQTILVLKGAGTVVAGSTDSVWINVTGNPGMARGGMGDVLSGMIGGLLARGLKPFDAARAGVYLHGAAGDLVRDRLGEEAMLASDLIALIPEAFQRLVSTPKRS